MPDVPDPMIAVIVAAFTTVKEVAAVLPKLTTVAFVKLVPVIVIVVPVTADVGVKDVMVGGQGVTTLAIKFPKERGSEPTAIVAITVLVAVPMTLTLPLLPLPLFTA